MQNNIKLIIIIATVAAVGLAMIGAGLFFEPTKTVSHEMPILNVAEGVNMHTAITTNNICKVDNVGNITTDYLKVNVDGSGNEDPVTVKYTITDCSSQTVEIEIYINGELASSKTKTKDSATHLFGGIDIDVGDNVKAVVKYTLR